MSKNWPLADYSEQEFKDKLGKLIFRQVQVPRFSRPDGEEYFRETHKEAMYIMGYHIDEYNNLGIVVKYHLYSLKCETIHYSYIAELKKQ